MKQFDTRPVAIKALFSTALEPVQARGPAGQDAGRQAPI
ncbi:phosphoribulokinase [Ralstonia solanacearum]